MPACAIFTLSITGKIKKFDKSEIQSKTTNGQKLIEASIAITKVSRNGMLTLTVFALHGS